MRSALVQTLTTPERRTDICPIPARADTDALNQARNADDDEVTAVLGGTGRVVVAKVAARCLPWRPRQGGCGRLQGG
jgi:hypothetical protein